MEAWDDNPPLTDAQLAEMRPASEVLPEIFGAEVAALLLEPPPKPSASRRRPTVALHVDADIIAAYRATGRGWKTRLLAVLRAHMPTASDPAE